MRRMKRIVLLLSLALTSVSFAKTWSIPSTYDEASGKWIGDVTSLTNAIKQSAVGDTIILSKGEYDVSCLTNAPMSDAGNTGYGTSLLHSGANWVTLKGGTENPADVVIDAKDAPYRVMTIGSNNCTVKYLTVKGGHSGDHARYNYKDAGGILMGGVSPVVDTCIIRDCSSVNHGGGVSAPHAAVKGTVRNCRFINNRSARGGGVSHCTTVSNCTFENNVATSNGGAVNNCTTVSGCTVVSNAASSNGGGLYLCPNVSDCTVVSNTASANGGGMGLCSNVVTCVIDYNLALVGGGAYQSSVSNCFIRHNVAATASGESSNASGGGVNASTVLDSVLADNHPTSSTGASVLRWCDIGGARMVDAAELDHCVIHGMTDRMTTRAVGNVAFPEGLQSEGSHMLSGCAVIRNCLITNCVWSAYTSAGGSYVNASLFGYGPSRFENCTIADNSYTYLLRYFTSGSGVTMVNCALVRNTGGDISYMNTSAAVITNCVYNKMGSVKSDLGEGSGIFDSVALGNGVDPKFIGTGDHPYQPQKNSPLCQKQGVLLDWMDVSAVDLAGNPRVREYGNRLNIGAYQHPYGPPQGLLLLFR